MKKWLLISGVVLMVSSVVFSACNKEDKTTNNNDGLDRKPMLVNYANNYILPGYSAMTDDLTALKSKSEAFTNTPNEANLNSLREAWRKAYLTWQKVDMLELGPAEGVSLRMYMNTYPVTVSKINANITSGNYDLEEFGNKDAQGFPAIDYLLHGVGSTPAEIISYYTTSGQATLHKEYLQAVVNKMLEKVQGVKNEWDTYKTTFTESTGTDVNGSLSKMTNSFVLYYERYLRSGKIGLPVGAMTGSAKPEIVESYYTPEFSKDLAVTALNSVKNFYEGKSFDGGIQDACMKTYLSSIGTKDDNGTLMADLISTEMNEAITGLGGINSNIKDAVQSDRTNVLTIYDQLQEIVPLLKVDMVSAFGISITYTDNDGD